MNYELAQKLKDAGFPQGGAFMGKNGNKVLTDDNNENQVIVPTLSELIEACGEEFRNLTKESYCWSTNFIEGDNYDYGETEGSTPEEAVANLFITLKK